MQCSACMKKWFQFPSLKLERKANLCYMYMLLFSQLCNTGLIYWSLLCGLITSLNTRFFGHVELDDRKKTVQFSGHYSKNAVLPLHYKV